jgi:hypothetical protein
MANPQLRHDDHPLDGGAALGPKVTSRIDSPDVHRLAPFVRIGGVVD